MAVGLQMKVRRALLPILRNDAALTAIVPAASIHPRVAKDRPYIRLRAPVTQPLRASCIRGGKVSWNIHAFASDRKSGDSTLEYAEDHAGRIGAAIEAALADIRIDIEGGGFARIRLSDIRLLEDDEPETYHWFAQVNAKVLAE